jgi:hypothetical protein
MASQVTCRRAIPAMVWTEGRGREAAKPFRTLIEMASSHGRPVAVMQTLDCVTAALDLSGDDALPATANMCSVGFAERAGQAATGLFRCWLFMEPSGALPASRRPMA